jgi:hypothetical protein
MRICAFVPPDRREVKGGIKEQVTSVDVGARVNKQARHAPRRLTQIQKSQYPSTLGPH